MAPFDEQNGRQQPQRVMPARIAKRELEIENQELKKFKKKIEVLIVNFKNDKILEIKNLEKKRKKN